LSGIRASGTGGKIREAYPTGQHGEEHPDGERTERVRAGGHGESDGAALLLRRYLIVFVLGVLKVPRHENFGSDFNFLLRVPSKPSWGQQVKGI